MTSKADKLWTDALRKTVLEHVKHPDEGSTEKIRNLNLIAKSLVAKARDGDIAAIKEIGDRLDGKPIQRTENQNDTKLSGTVFVKTGVPDRK